MPLNVIGGFGLRPFFSWKNPNASGVGRLNGLLHQTMKAWYLLALRFGVSRQGA